MSHTILDYRITAYIPSKVWAKVERSLPESYTVQTGRGMWRGEFEPVNVVTIYCPDYLGAYAQRNALTNSLLAAGETAALVCVEFVTAILTSKGE